MIKIIDLVIYTKKLLHLFINNINKILKINVFTLYMWKINGKIYDLTNFLDKHPGGRKILEVCEGNHDLTPSFESYHAMCDMNKIKKIMEKYEISTCEPSIFTFDENGFYKTLQKRVNDTFYKKNYKVEYWGILKSLLQFSIFVFFFFNSFYVHSNNMIYRCFSSGISGHFIIQVGFCVMHDASHFAVSNKSYINEFLCNSVNAIFLWDGPLWLQHHAFRHHAFTGDKDLDPDTIHFKPFYRKIKDDNGKKYLQISKKFPKTITLFTSCIFPGMFLGQMNSYILWLIRGHLWKMTLHTAYKISIWQTMLKLFMIFSFFYGQSFLVFFIYIFMTNISYFLCIIPDHDTFETCKNRSDTKKKQDWGELQVRHSGNFSTQNDLVCYMFGGINYQIEHHLFPTISHLHYHKIKPIVQQTCKEFDIPYVHFDSVFSALLSGLENYSNVANL